MFKRYPRKEENTLAYRIACKWLEFATSVIERGDTPAKLSKCFLDDDRYVWDHIYSYEHHQAVQQGYEGYSLTKAARARIEQMALGHGMRMLRRGEYPVVREWLTKK